MRFKSSWLIDHFLFLFLFLVLFLVLVLVLFLVRLSFLSKWDNCVVLVEYLWTEVKESSLRLCNLLAVRCT